MQIQMARALMLQFIIESF